MYDRDNLTVAEAAQNNTTAEVVDGRLWIQEHNHGQAFIIGHTVPVKQ